MLVEWNNARPDVFLRLLGIGAADAAAALAAAGVEAAVDGQHGPAGGWAWMRVALWTWSRPWCRIRGPRGLGALAASMVRAGSRICGAVLLGKTLALAQAPGVAYVLAADRSARRLRRLRENVDMIAGRLDRPLPLGLAVADARRAPVAAADLVLLDGAVHGHRHVPPSSGCAVPH